jgi:LicD family
MLLSRVTRDAKRVRIFLICAVIILFLYVILPAKRPTPPPPPLLGTYQYFVETDFHSTTKHFGAVSHCDARFAPKEKPGIDETRRSLAALLKSYAATMNQLNVETWIAHGALIGWYWNRKLLPWDTDLDVQMSAKSIAFLAQSHNMTEYHYPMSPGEASRTYLLDINPHYSIVSDQDVANKIDGRWIDMTSGKFIDITAVHHEKVGRGKGKSSILFCKDGHRYKVISPPNGYNLQLLLKP